MPYIIFEDVGKDVDVVNKNSIIFPVFFQDTVYKALYINWRIRKIYKNDFKMLYIILVDKDKLISIIQINKELEKEIEYIDNSDVFFIANKIDDILL